MENMGRREWTVQSISVLLILHCEIHECFHLVQIMCVCVCIQIYLFKESHNLHYPHYFSGSLLAGNCCQESELCIEPKYFYADHEPNNLLSDRSFLAGNFICAGKIFLRLGLFQLFPFY